MVSSSAPRTRRGEAVEQLHEQLRESLHALVTSEDWQNVLAVAARFHDYSFANTQLISAQAAARGFTPTRVAGYRTWQKLGRQVKRGEKGIQILAPVTRTMETDDGEEERRVVGFRVVHVFDQSQTDGQPLPEVRPAVLEGELPVHWEKLAELITSAGFRLEAADVDRLGEANGITNWRDRQVLVRESLPGAQRFKTGVHELAHIRLHEPASGLRPNCRGIVEVEAESVAYMVCAALGVDSAGYSLPYVATWSGGDLEKVSATAERVIRCARGVLGPLRPETDLTRDLSPPQVTAIDQRHLAVTETQAPGPAQSASTGDRTQELAEALRSAVTFYQERLEHHDGAQARSFLQQPGFSIDTVRHWQLGYAPARWDSLVRELRRQGIPDQILLDAGLVGRARTGRLYDRMRGRIVFPIHDPQGSPVGFAGRLITGDGPKYLNSPETPLYKKSELLYGLHQATPSISRIGETVIVEGYTDVIATHQAGITNAVATGGTALTSHQLHTLGPIASTVTLAFDGDKAGLQAAERLAELPTTTLRSLHLRVARLPGDTDPASLITDSRADDLRAALANATPLVHHLIDQTLQRYDLHEIEAPVRALYAVTPLVEHLTDPTDRPTVIRYLADRLQRDEDHIEQALRQSAQVHRRSREHERSRGRILT